MHLPKTKSRRVIIRADATPEMGVGHLMRCLALAQALRAADRDVTFITQCKNNLLAQRLSDGGIEVIRLKRHHPAPVDWQTTSQILQSYPDAWLVLDGYQFDPFYQCNIKEAGHRLLVIDDTAHLDRYFGDIVLNQNLHLTQLKYSAEPETRFLLGPRYVLLRSEFKAWKGTHNKIPQIARKILVTMGGGNDQNQTLQVMRALQDTKTEGLEAVVIAGASNPNRSVLESEADRSTCPIRLLYNADNMPELMAWADLAVCAGGTTCWELAFMGVPSLVIILAENQQGNAQGLEEEGFAINMGWFSRLSHKVIAQKLSEITKNTEMRVKMSRSGRFLVDGKGIDRVLMELAPK